MRKFIILLVSVLALSCKNDNSQPAVPEHPVADDEKFITEAYVDSLETNRKQRLIDLRRDLGFNCVDLMPNEYINIKLKVYPDGKFDDPEVLDKEGVPMDSVRNCIENYFNTHDLDLGILKDLPASGKTTNKFPHVYTLLIY